MVEVYANDISREEYERLLDQTELALDTETSGLSPTHDRLHLIQLATRNGRAVLVQHPSPTGMISELIATSKAEFIIHFARFDLAFLARQMKVMPARVVCTKIAARLVGTYSKPESLQILAKEVLGVSLDKSIELKTSDWAAPLSAAQQTYASRDVLHLHGIWDRLRNQLHDRGLDALAAECFFATRVIARADSLGLERLFEHG